MRKTLYLIGALVSLLIFYWHSQAGLISFLDKIGAQQLQVANQEFLRASESQSKEAFFLLTGIKTGLALIESSNAGISFFIDVEVQVGKLAQALSDMVHYAWQGSFISLGMIRLIELILSLFNSLSVPILYIALPLLAIELFLQGLNRPSIIRQNILSKLGWGFLVAYLLAPLAIYTGALCSKELTKESSEQVRIKLHKHAKELSFDEPATGLKEQSEQGVSRFLDISKKLPETHESLSQSLSHHLILLLFDLLIFPLFFFLIFVSATRFVFFNCKKTN